MMDDGDITKPLCLRSILASMGDALEVRITDATPEPVGGLSLAGLPVTGFGALSGASQGLGVPFSLCP
jgi:hypothetical protein